jgi:signal transduction histidine kinase
MIMTSKSDPPIPAQRDHRARPAADDPEVFRGLLHDVGHGLATLALLLEGARGTVTAARGNRLFDLAEAETARLLKTVHDGLRGTTGPSGEPIAVRAVLARIVELAEHSRSTSVVLVPGPELALRIDPTTLWRVVGNVVDNAVRAAGPVGHVQVVLAAAPHDTAPDGGVVIDVVDNGPGFHRGPSGVARIGLDIVTRLIAANGGRLEIEDIPDRGSRVRVLLADPASAQEGAEHAARRAV